MYTLTLSEEQVQEVRYALAWVIGYRHDYAERTGIELRSTDVMQQAHAAIAEQWHAQHVAQRDAALKESTS